MKICLFTIYDCQNTKLMRRISKLLGGYTEVQLEDKMQSYYIPNENVKEFSKYKLKGQKYEMNHIIDSFSLVPFNLSLEQREYLANDDEVSNMVKIKDIDIDRYSIIQVSTPHGYAEMIGR